MTNIITEYQQPSKRSKTSHKNFMGGPSWDITNPITQLRVAAASCFFGEPMYYYSTGEKKKTYVVPGVDRNAVAHARAMLGSVVPETWNGMSPAQLMEQAIDKALDFDPEATLQEAVRLRNEEHIRTTPQVIMVRAAHHPKVRGTGLVRKYGAHIMMRADEPTVQLAYHLFRYGDSKPIPNSLKKAWRNALSSFKEYNLAKYRGEGRGVKMVDVMNLTHPKSEAITKLANGELKTTGETWESIISAEGSTKEAWTKAVDVMGHMAILRNLRNLSDKGVPESVYLPKLVQGAATGQQLPFRYYSAYQANRGKSGPLLDAIEDCLMQSLGNLPQFKGRVMSLCDNSGSARRTTTSSLGTVLMSDIANLTGVITGMAAEDGYVGVFGDRLKTQAIRKKASVFDQLKQIDAAGANIGGATEHGIWLFWDKAIKEKEHWDHVFIYSDMQAGHGGLYGVGGYPGYLYPRSGYAYIDVPKLINKYRATVNPNVNVYLVQVAGYQDTIVPEYYDRTYILGGWGEGILRFAAHMANLRGNNQ